MKRITILATLALGLGLVSTAQAATTTDSLTVTITPNAYYAVAIDTASVSLDLGSVALNAQTATVSPATVTIQSTYATTELDLDGTIASGGTAWTFSADSTTAEQDKLVGWAVFTDTSVASAPAQSDETGHFNGTTQGTASDMFGLGNFAVGNAGGGESRFLSATDAGGYKSMNDMPNNIVDNPASRSHLWLRFRLPGSSTSSNAQNITVKLTAKQPQ
mgnify:CR=1 FL=1